MYNKKIFIICISVVACLILLACVVLATVDDSFVKGENYDVFHEENGCCTLDSGAEPHYVTGYKDGLADQQDKIDTQQSTIASQQSTIDSLKQELNEDNNDNEDNPNEPDVPENPEDNTGGNSDSEWRDKYYQLLSLFKERLQCYV